MAQILEKKNHRVEIFIYVVSFSANSKRKNWIKQNKEIIDAKCYENKKSTETFHSPLARNNNGNFYCFCFWFISIHPRLFVKKLRCPIQRAVNVNIVPLFQFQISNDDSKTPPTPTKSSKTAQPDNLIAPRHQVWPFECH